MPVPVFTFAQSGDPGRRRAGDDLAPYVVLEVAGQATRSVSSFETRLGEDIMRYVQSVDFESALDMADLGSIRISNPGVMAAEADNTQPPDWVSHRAFQPGNEVNILIGYGTAPPKFVGRVHLAKHLPMYPSGDEIPSLEVKGYSKSHLMMNASGEITGGANGVPRLQVVRPVGENDNQGQVFSNTRHSDIVSALAAMYGFDTDIDVTTRPEEVVLKKGMKHYEIIQSLANINDREFFVDFDYTRRKWVLHWKEPARTQRSTYTFTYGFGDNSTLLSFQPEYGLRETVTDVTILIFDRTNNRWISAGLFNIAEDPDPRFQQGGGLQARSQVTRSRRGPSPAQRREARAAQQTIDEAFQNPGAFRISAGGVAIDVLPPGERFRDVETAARFLLRWFQRRRDNFILAKGTVIGVETLRARQVHRIQGVSARLDGDYYFISARHHIEESYTCEFTAHKVMTDEVES